MSILGPNKDDNSGRLMTTDDNRHNDFQGDPAFSVACQIIFRFMKGFTIILGTWEPVLAWEREARCIESGVITRYVMLLLCYDV